MRGLPAGWYTDPGRGPLEFSNVFARSWQFVCHVNQLRKPGDFATLDMLRDSIVAIRGKDGVVRAFANACRHRGSKLLDGAGSCRGRITCPYHGWSYGFDGRLAAVPSEKTFRGIDKSEFGLKPVEVEILLGLVFVRVAGPGPSLAEMWGDFVEVAGLVVVMIIGIVYVAQGKADFGVLAEFEPAAGENWVFALIAGVALEDSGRRKVVGIDASKTLDKTVAQVTSIARTTAAAIGVTRDLRDEGKSMAGLIGMIRSGAIPAGSRVLYAHLGGQPALSAYAHTPGLGGQEPSREPVR